MERCVDVCVRVCRMSVCARPSHTHPGNSAAIKRRRGRKSNRYVRGRGRELGVSEKGDGFVTSTLKWNDWRGGEKRLEQMLCFRIAHPLRERATSCT